jgi:aryl-alcohol dehydrogenase-like predicted oxidoreductase
MAESKRSARSRRRERGDVAQRPFRDGGPHVSILGLGGYHLGNIESDREAVRLVQAAIDRGVTFLDNAWEYHDGRSERLMGRALEGRRDRVFLMTKVCTHGRDAKVAMRQLGESLKRLRTDYLDLWQIHECVYDNDPERHFAAGGVVDALDRAKREGKVRFVGFTGHKTPDILLRMLAYDYPFDACQMPLNCFDASFRSFERRVLPELLRRRVAPLGMKSLCGDGRPAKKRAVSAEDALRYAMSLPVVTTISGIDSMRVLQRNVRIARGFEPLSDAEMQRIRRRASGPAADGRFELFKTTAQHEGPEGRAQHGFPSEEELPA